jgi:hypothetical protein
MLETACAMMIAGSLPPHFWVDAVLVSTYLINIQSLTACKAALLLNAFLVVLMSTQRFDCLVAFAMSFLSRENAPS